MRTILLMLCGVTAFAETRTLTLRQALDLALQQNPDLVIARLDQERARFAQLDGQCRVENVRRSQPLMNPARNNYWLLDSVAGWHIASGNSSAPDLSAMCSASASLCIPMYKHTLALSQTYISSIHFVVWC